jgi:hypothetical protein
MMSFDGSLTEDSAIPFTLMRTDTDHYRGRAINLVALAAPTPNAPVPPGIGTLPAPGEVLVSPALAKLMSSSPVLAERYGDVIGRVGSSALFGPDHMLAIRGVSPTDPGMLPVVAFPRNGQVRQFGGIIRLVILLGGVAMLAPVALLVAMATRMATASRDRRLAALRLAGATTGQVARLAAVESLVAGVGGVAAGMALFFVVRPLATYVTYDGDRWFNSDLSPPVLGFALVVIGAPLVTAAAAQVTLARVARSPLGVGRRVAPRPVRVWRVVPLVVTVPLLGYALASDSASQAAGGHGRLVLATFLVLMTALVVAGPWFTRIVGLVLARSGGPARLLAGRRLVDDPRSGFRGVAGVILAIMITTTFVATTPAAARSLRDTRIVGQQAGSAQVNLLFNTPVRSGELLEDARAIAGISAVALVYEGLIQTGQDSVPVWIGDCDEIVRSARLSSIPCSRAPVLVAENHLEPAPGAVITIDNLWSATVTPDGFSPPEFLNTTVVSAEAMSSMPAQRGVGAPGVIVSPDTLGPKLFELRPTLMVLRYEDAAALERARTLVLQQVPGGSVSTRETTYEGFSSDTRRLYRVLTFATLGAFAVAGFSLVVASAVGLFERRRPFALLRAAGTPLRTLRRTVFLEAAAPLAVMSIISALLGILAGRWAVQSSGESESLPWTGLSAPIIAGVVITLAVVASAAPMVRRATSTEETRFE